MRTLRACLRDTPAGAMLRQCICRLYALGESMRHRVRQVNLLRSQARKQYQFWRNRRCLRPIIAGERQLLIRAREEQESLYAASDADPLVSVVIPTWNRGQLLAARTLPSVLNQTHRNIEVIIVGDCCTDRTGSLLASIDDPRIRFVNLPQRGQYPSDKRGLWQVAGSAPKNRGLELCSGAWIAPLDDDDVFTPDHIESLLRYAQNSGLELVYGKLRIEETPGMWKEKGPVNEHMSIQNSTMLFRSYLKLFRSDINAWRVGLTGDYHRTIRYRETGVRIGYLDKVVALMPLRPGQIRMGLSADDRPGAAVG